VRVVVDTNVLMSGIFFGGTPGRIVDALKQGEAVLIVSPSIIEEYRRVGEELEATYGELGAPSLVTLFVAHAEVIDAPDLTEPVSRDPGDDKFLACARAASVSILISGDRDLQTLGSWQDVHIMSPRAFADQYLSRGGT
jgi:putative PIN family toxin of toxin-antitoxin system